MNQRFVAGLKFGHDLTEGDRQVLAKAGATVLDHFPRLELLVLRIDDLEAFVVPGFVAFLEEDRGFTTSEE